MERRKRPLDGVKSYMKKIESFTEKVNEMDQKFKKELKKLTSDPSKAYTPSLEMWRERRKEEEESRYQGPGKS